MVMVYVGGEGLICRVISEYIVQGYELQFYAIKCKSKEKKIIARVAYDVLNHIKSDVMERYRVKIKKDYSISAEHGEHMFRNSLEWKYTCK